MPVTDPIADMLTRIRNALMRKMDEVRVRRNNVCVAIAKTLKEEGFIADYEEVPNLECKVQPDLLIKLKYGPGGESPITHIARVSKPGRRIYKRKAELKPILRGLGITVLSTPKGVMSDRQARDANVGGEVLCLVE